jgi:hypothetical protein
MTTGTAISGLCSAQGPSHLWASAGPLLASFLSVAVGLYAVSVATRQSKTAEENLRHELFDRRFKIWESTNEAVLAHTDVISALTVEQFNLGEWTHPTLARFAAARREAQFLFGDEVLDGYRRIEQLMQRYLSARVGFLFPPEAELSPQQRMENATAHGRSYLAVLEEQEVLMVLVEPYLDLSAIAIARPGLLVRRRRALEKFLSAGRQWFRDTFRPSRGPSGPI